ncbi:MAG: NAD(P)/FAD-dependent oxidoreductase, partial [Chloroflexaceae bacterium]|nr:NAD(P)/FAD-dependent oxidoreductase [Chloroflexaceae bacterium]
MLQRSPTYVLARPSEDGVALAMQRLLPPTVAARAARWKAVLVNTFFYYLARWFPTATRQAIIRMVQQHLGPGYDVATHFTPRYNPWDQRLCLAADADLFRAIRSGRATVVTDEIATFTETGIRLCSGRELAADVIVTATGLVIKLMGGAELVVDGRTVDLAGTLSYKGMMYSDIPNLASAFGYTNASWTLKCELTAAYVCRLLNYMGHHGYRQCTPRRRDPNLGTVPALD